MRPRFPFKEQALRARVWVFVVGTRLYRAAAVAPPHFSSTAVEQEPKREQRKGFCFSCDIWGQLLPCAGSGGRKAKIRAEATHWSSWLYLGMCKPVDGFSDQFLPQAECSDYELQHLPFHFFFCSNGARKKKKSSFLPKEVLNHVQYIYPFHSHSSVQNFQSPAAVSHPGSSTLL